MWMLAQKQVEQWILAVILNAVSTYLYLTQTLFPTSALYLVYTIVSVMGYFNWKKQSK
jgi:nicotinamide mononucleotide transporter